MAAAHGKPAYVEKPMARSPAECQRMNAAFARARVPLFVAYYRRRLPRFLTIQEWLTAGVLGTVTSVSYRMTRAKHQADGGWRTRPEISGGGYFMDVGCHVLDLLDFLLGPLTQIAGGATNIASPYAAEDSVAMTFRTAGNALGTALFNFSAAIADDTLHITGTNGEISASVFGDEPVRLSTTAGATAVARPNPRHIQLPLIETIVADLLGRGTCPSTGKSAARTAAVMDAVLAPFYTRTER
jgi:predicted dehydrogenase